MVERTTVNQKVVNNYSTKSTAIEYVMDPFSDTPLLAKLVGFIKDNGGHIPKNKIGDFYRMHPHYRFKDMLKNGRLKKFCQNNPSNLLWEEEVSDHVGYIRLVSDILPLNVVRDAMQASNISLPYDSKGFIHKAPKLDQSQLVEDLIKFIIMRGGEICVNKIDEFYLEYTHKGYRERMSGSRKLKTICHNSSGRLIWIEDRPGFLQRIRVSSGQESK